MGSRINYSVGFTSRRQSLKDAQMLSGGGLSCFIILTSIIAAPKTANSIEPHSPHSPHRPNFRCFAKPMTQRPSCIVSAATCTLLAIYLARTFQGLGPAIFPFPLRLLKLGQNTVAPNTTHAQCRYSQPHQDGQCKHSPHCQYRQPN